MSAIVSFLKPAGLGSINAPGIGHVRTTEVLMVPGTTTATVQADEIVYVLNNDVSAILVAFGTTPDAAAATATAVTSAGVGIGMGMGLPLAPKVGDKVNIKATI